MLSCEHDLFRFCLLLFYLLLPSMGWLCGVGVFRLIVLEDIEARASIIEDIEARASIIEDIEARA